MNNEEKDLEANRIDQLVEKAFNEFKAHIYKENDLSVILLKSHLLIEYYLDHLILLGPDDINERVDLRKIGFYKKLSILRESNSFFEKEGIMLRTLYRLNDIRNNLAHRLDFAISQSEIDYIGYPLGKEYILDKYKLPDNSPESTRKLLLGLMSRIISIVHFPLISTLLKEEESSKKN